MKDHASVFLFQYVSFNIFNSKTVPLNHFMLIQQQRLSNKKVGISPLNTSFILFSHSALRLVS